MDIQRYAVGSLDTIFYFPEFLGSDEQEMLCSRVRSAPPAKWKCLKNRRLQNWGGVVHEKGLIPQSLPPWLTSLTENIVNKIGLFPSPINHVLVNEYESGQGIMPHQDGPLYFPVVAIVSLGSPTVMRFSPHMKIAPKEEISPVNDENGNGSEKASKDVSIILMPGSLLVFKDSAYKGKLLHVRFLSLGIASYRETTALQGTEDYPTHDFKDFADYLHGIEECVEHLLDDTVINPEQISAQEPSGKLDGHPSLRRTGTRISLTCRYVPKVILSKLFNLR